MPVDLEHVGATAREVAPRVRQLVVAASPELAADRDAFERKLYVIRRVAEIAAGPELVIPSFSARTLVYKGMLMAPQLARCYPDLRDERMKSALVLVHSRFSTNTFPSWELAHPYRMIAHNGEINTVRGNVNWMRARESQLASELFGDDLQKVLPVVRPGGSDTANFDNVLELLVLAGRSLPHAMMMMIPEAYDGREDMPGGAAGLLRLPRLPDRAVGRPGRRSRSPTARVIGATLDRNGLRPGRWLETRTAGSCSPPRPACSTSRPENVLRKGRLQPGQAVPRRPRARAASSRTRRSSARSPTRQPYGEWFEQGVVHLDDLPDRAPRVPRVEPLRAPPARVRLHAGGPAGDPRAARAERARSRSARWATTSRSPSSPTSQPPLYSYFKQLFAQVTNPPIDPIREAVVMSVATSVGSERNLLDETPEHARQLVIDQPILRNGELETLRQVDSDVFEAHTIDITWPVAEGRAGLERGARAHLRRGRRGARATASTSSSSPTATSGADRVADPGAARRRRRCTTTSSARARACRPASWSSPASRARCTTSRR